MPYLVKNCLQVRKSEKNCLHNNLKKIIAQKVKGKKLFSKQFLKETFPYDVLYEFGMYALILQQEILWTLSCFGVGLVVIKARVLFLFKGCLTLFSMCFLPLTLCATQA